MRNTAISRPDSRSCPTLNPFPLQEGTSRTACPFSLREGGGRVRQAHSLARGLLCLALLCCGLTDAVRGEAQRAAGPIRLEVDATDAPRNRFRVRLIFPVSPGAWTLLYPKWTPGNHGQTGPVTNLAGLRLKAGGKPLEWRRDAVELYAFHCEIPPGVTTVEAEAEFLGAVAGGSLEPGTAATSQLAVINWNTLLLYPQGTPVDALSYVATLRLPRGWRYGTALAVASERPEGVTFQPVSLMTLVDSPLLTGARFRTISLSSGSGPAHLLRIAADSDEALEMPEEMIAGYRRMVQETAALFGCHPYRNYHFLLTLSSRLRRVGLEHHESSDNRVAERTLLDEKTRREFVTLLPHEFVHAWNGKMRRPKGMLFTDYNTPMQTELLWVYEGLTNHLGKLLATRSGLWKPEEYRERLAYVTADLDHEEGRAWRSLADTATAAPLRRSMPPHGEYSLRGIDYYVEPELIWLEVDVLIRQKTQGRRSLDDFCRLFFGGQDGAPIVLPYTYEEMLTALQAIAPYDWPGFFEARVYTVNKRAPVGGIEGSGWRLVYGERPNGMAHSAVSTYSLGLILKADGVIEEVVPGLPADKAGIVAGMKVIAVNGRRFTEERLKEAVRRSRSANRALELLLERDDYFTTARLDYRGGERFPHLERLAGRPDLLTEMLKPRVPPKTKE